MYSTHKLTPDVDGKHLRTPLKANYVGISEIFITNDWYNLTTTGKIQSRAIGTDQPVATTPINPGLYTLDSLSKRFGIQGAMMELYG